MEGWRKNLAGIWVAQMLAIIGFNTRAPFFVFFLRDDLGVRSTHDLTLWAGALNAAGALTMTVFAPIWGTLADRYGRKPMVIRAMFSGCVLAVLSSFATLPWHVLVLRFLEGATLGTVSASVAYVASISPRERLGFSLGLMQMAVFSGASIGPLFGGFLADHLGYRHTLWVSGGLLGLGGVVAWLFVREAVRPRARTRGAQPGFVANTRRHLRNRLLLILIAVPFLEQIANQSIQPIVPLFVRQLAGERGDIASVTGLLLGLGGIAGAISAVILGRLSDRVNPKTVLLICLGIGGLSYFPQGLAPTVTVLIISRVLFGFTTGGVGPTTNALLAAITPREEQGSVYGLQQAMISAGGLVGPLGAAFLAAGFSLRAPFFVTGIILLGATAWTWREVPQQIADRIAEFPAELPGERTQPSAIT